MDELEFRKRVYANPQDPGPEALAAARENPAYRLILDRSIEIDKRLRSVTQDVEVPAGLEARLMQIAETDPDAGDSDRVVEPKRARVYRYYAIAASLLLIVGVAYTQLLGPAPGSLESEVIAHMDHEESQLAAIRAGSLGTEVPMPVIAEVMNVVGAQLRAGDYLETMAVRYANPCLILPGYESAHLIIDTADGPLNVIVIDNSPVAAELEFAGRGFSGVVVPLPAGNLIVLGDSAADIQSYRDIFVAHVDQVI